MSINLIKGQKINLSKDKPQLRNILFSFGWNAPKNYEMDLSLFMLDSNGKILNENYMIFYNNLTSPDNAVHHQLQENKKNSNENETITVNLDKLNSQIQELVFVVTINEANENKQNFSNIANTYIKLYDNSSISPLLCYEYNLTDSFKNETALEFCKLYKKDNQWRLQAVGQGFNAGLQAFVDQYYVETKNEDKKEEKQKVEQNQLSLYKSIEFEKN